MFDLPKAAFDYNNCDMEPLPGLWCQFCCWLYTTKFDELYVTKVDSDLVRYNKCVD